MPKHVVKFIYLLILLKLCYAEDIFLCPSKCNCPKTRQRNGEEIFKIKCGGDLEKISTVEELNIGSWNKRQNVIHLNLSENEISSLSAESFASLPMLQKLDLSRNHIESVEIGAFANLTNLKRLDLSGNKLQIIGVSMFDGLSQLEKLKLSQNGVTKIKHGAFDGLNELRQLDLSGNPLICDCHLSWVVIWAQNSSVKLSPSPKCNNPPSLRGQPLRKQPAYNEDCTLLHSSTSLELRPSHNQVVFEGDSLRLKCRADVFSGSSEPRVMWFYENEIASSVFNKILIENKKLSGGGLVESSISINPLLKDHTGKWNCHLVSEEGNQSAAISVIVISEETQYCPQNITRSNKGSYSWPKTVVGNTVELPCVGDGISDLEQRKAQHICDSNGQWSGLNTSQCPFVNPATNKLQEFSRTSILLQGNIIETAKLFKNFTCNLQVNDKMEIVFIAQTIANFVVFVSKDKELSSILVDIIESTMKASKGLMIEAQIDSSACNILVSSIESLMELTPLQINKPLLAVEKFIIQRDDFTGLTCKWIVYPTKNSNRTFVCSTINSSSHFGNPKEIEASIHVPNTLFFQLKEKGIQINSSRQLLLSAYENNQLFPYISSDGMDVTSCIVGAKLIGMEVILLTEPVAIQLRLPTTSELATVRPVWWDASANNGTGMWQEDGCQLVDLHHGLLVFHCYRLGYFGLKHRIVSSEIRLLVPKFRFSHPTIYLGNFLTMTCLLLSAVTYIMCYKYIQMSKKIKHSLINTWISLSLLCFVFSIGIFRAEDMEICQGVGLIIHFLTLSSLLWMCVTVCNMYKHDSHMDMLSSTSSPEDDLPPSSIPVTQKPPLLGIYLVGWGIALMICGISGAVNLRQYWTPEYCFLASIPALSAVYVPVFILLCFICTVSVMVRCSPASLGDANGRLSEGTQVTENVDLELLDSSHIGGENTSLHSDSVPTASDFEDQEHSTLTHIKAHLIVLLFYVLSWLSAAASTALPFTSLPPYQDAIFGALYCIFSTFDGAFILFFYCIARSDVRAQWHIGSIECRRKRGRCCRTRSISDTNPSLPANQPVVAVTRIGALPGALSSTNSVDSSHKSQQNSSLERHKAKATITSNGTVQIQSKNNDSISVNCKKSSLDFVALHRKQYRSQNSVLAHQTEASGLSSAEAFYNPYQSTVARKFFRKQRRHLQQNNLATRRSTGDGGGTVSEGDTYTRAESAVFLSSDMENTSSSKTFSPGGKSSADNFQVPIKPSENENDSEPPLERLVIGAEESPSFQMSASTNSHLPVRSGTLEELPEENSLAVDCSEIDSELQLGRTPESLADVASENSCSANISCGEFPLSRTCSSGGLNTSFELDNFKTDVLFCSNINDDGSSKYNEPETDSILTADSESVSEILPSPSVASLSLNSRSESKHSKYASRSPRSKRRSRGLKDHYFKKDNEPNTENGVCKFIDSSKKSEGNNHNRELNGYLLDNCTNTEELHLNKRETSV